MTISYSQREKIFNQIMKETRKSLYKILQLDIHKKFKKTKSNKDYIPVLSYNPKLKKYRFNCYCYDCPFNRNGLCSTEFVNIPKHLFHEFDGDNIIKNICG